MQRASRAGTGGKRSGPKQEDAKRIAMDERRKVSLGAVAGLGDSLINIARPLSMVRTYVCIVYICVTYDLNENFGNFRS